MNNWQFWRKESLWYHSWMRRRNQRDLVLPCDKVIVFHTTCLAMADAYLTDKYRNTFQEMTSVPNSASTWPFHLSSYLAHPLLQMPLHPNWTNWGPLITMWLPFSSAVWRHLSMSARTIGYVTSSVMKPGLCNWSGLNKRNLLTSHWESGP